MLFISFTEPHLSKTFYIISRNLRFCVIVHELDNINNDIIPIYIFETKNDC